MTPIGWSGISRPNWLEVAPGTDPERTATVVIEPLELGFGLTLGNALRRILLSSLRGVSLHSVKINGVMQELSSIPGVREDVTNILRSVENITILTQGDGLRSLVVEKSGPAVITAGDIQAVADVEVVNPDLVLCHLDEETSIRMEFNVGIGTSYVPVRYEPIDQLLGKRHDPPVKAVSYNVEKIRGRYDRLTMEIETNGLVIPDFALAFAVKMLQEHLSVFGDLQNSSRYEQRRFLADDDTGDLPAVFFTKVKEFGFSARTANCLEIGNIVYIGDLVQKTEAEMLRTPFFGRGSMNEIKEKLANMGLHLGMELPGWQGLVENAEEVAEDAYELALSDFRISRIESDQLENVTYSESESTYYGLPVGREEEKALEAEQHVLNQIHIGLQRLSKSCQDLELDLDEYSASIVEFREWAQKAGKRV